MKYKKEKIDRLFQVAHLYYIEDRTQAEIAERLQVSRPLVSRMLREARQLGIVEIRVHPLGCDQDALMKQLSQRYGIQGGALLAEADEEIMNRNLVRKILEYIKEEQVRTLGIGWGDTIGMMAELLETVPPLHTSVHTVCPLLGNSNGSIRRYHTDENVRIIAESIGAYPKFLHMPVLPVNQQERRLWMETNQYRTVSTLWENMDMAIIGIHETNAAQDVSYPSFDGRTMGYMAAYQFDRDGTFFVPKEDRFIHIPLESLKKCRKIVGVCTSDVAVDTLAAALKTGLLTHIFASEEQITAVLSSGSHIS